MTFVFRCLLVLIIFSFIVYVFKALARIRYNMRGTMKDVRKLRDQVVGGPSGGAEMVKCVACGAFVFPREAVTIKSQKTTQIFCSTECLHQHVKQ